MKEVSDLGVATKTTPGELFSLLEKQPNGEAGPLLVNGYANLFEMEDIDGVSRLVYAGWHDDGWYVDSRSVTCSDQWFGEFQVFSRNSR